ncbi:MAG: protein kinase [Labilithrix sp.]|nr:protein kinase [Labilithrix sp.]MCW5818100.1 protein kinase [Labilithrix sp.]
MAAALSIGDEIAGRYRLEGTLGSGGMGQVWSARHVGLDERVAIKVLRPERAGGERDLERFRREARAAARIRGENVVRVLDFGTLDEARPYIVMELVDGTNLESLLAEAGPLPPARAASYVLQACYAMAEAHRLGIVHRDLKPSNLLLTRRPDGSALVKVSDFGIATAGALASDTLTETTDILGSPKYMSPEQLREARAVDARSDVWSIGVTLHHLLTGKLPFEAFTAAGLIARITSEPPVPVREQAPQVDARLERLILRCLEKEPERRYEDVAELAAALVPFANADDAAAERVRRTLLRPRTERPAATVTAPRVEADANTVVPTERPATLTERSASRPLRFVLLAGAVVPLAAVFALTAASRVAPKAADPSVAPPSAPAREEPPPVESPARDEPAPAVSTSPEVAVAPLPATVAAAARPAPAPRPAASAPPARPIVQPSSSATKVNLLDYGPRK